jgi:lipopolysaccharide transport system permease protein
MATTAPTTKPRPPAAAHVDVVVIEPSSGWPSLHLREFWRYRELLYFLAWRDVKVRYKQTALGVTWAVLQPVLTMIVFTIFFGHVAKLPSEGLPYPLFSLAGLLPWTFFATGLTQSAGSLVASSNLITKVYFPRLVVPVASTLAGIVDIGFALIVLLAMMVGYGVMPGPELILVPPILVLALAATLGVGLWFAALNVQYRDVRYIVPVLVQLWLLATPIAYPSSLIEEPWRTLYGLNPMAGVVESFRWAVVGTPAPPIGMVALSAAVSVVLVVGGAYYFRRIERRFADVV